MKLIDTPIGTKIEGFYYKADFYPFAGHVVKVVSADKTQQRVGFILHSAEEDKNIVTYVTGFKLAGA